MYNNRPRAIFILFCSYILGFFMNQLGIPTYYNDLIKQK